MTLLHTPINPNFLLIPNDTNFWPTTWTSILPKFKKTWCNTWVKFVTITLIANHPFKGELNGHSFPFIKHICMDPHPTTIVDCSHLINKYEMNLTIFKTSIILPITMSHNHNHLPPRQIILIVFWGCVWLSHTFQIFILCHCSTLTWNMKVKCKLGFLTLFITLHAHRYLFEYIHWLI